MTTRAKSKHLVLRIDEETLRSLKEEADTLGTSLSEVARYRLSLSPVAILLGSIDKRLSRLEKSNGEVQG